MFRTATVSRGVVTSQFVTYINRAGTLVPPFFSPLPSFYLFIFFDVYAELSPCDLTAHETGATEHDVRRPPLSRVVRSTEGREKNKQAVALPTPAAGPEISPGGGYKGKK